MDTAEKRRHSAIAARNPVGCETCGRRGGLLLACGPRRYRGEGALCLRCADFDHLAFLPSADAALTRRAGQASRMTVVVDWWNSQRPRRFGYDRRERLGILVEYRALELAARQCLDDPAALVDRRTRDERRIAKGRIGWEDLAATIRAQFPGCPRTDVVAYYVALHTKASDAIELAVTASVRHVDTDYDELLASGVDRAEADARVAHRIDAILDAWRHGAVPLDD